MDPASKRVVVKGLPKRDLFIGIAIGALLLGLLLFGFLHMSRDAGGGWVTGQIVAKQFTPLAPETEVTFGKGGVHEHVKDGEYLLKIYVAHEKRTYDVLVGKEAYQQAKEGQDFRFLR